MKQLVLGIGALALLAIPTVVSAQAPAGEQVHVVVTRVRATGELAAGASADIDPKLEKLQIPKLRQGYAKYSQDQVIEKWMPWGETFTVPVDPSKGDQGGRYEIVPVKPGKDAGRLVVKVREIAPRGGEPCLELESEVQAGRLNLWFCDGTIDGGTMLFFVRAEAGAK